MELWNLKIKDFYSFDPNEKADSKYQLLDLSTQYRSELSMFLNDIKRLESKNSNTILALRGESKKCLRLHNDFFQNRLNQLFMVGSKARSNYQISSEDDFGFYKGKTKTELIEEVKKIVQACNQEIQLKPDKHPVKGKITDEFIEKIIGGDINELEHWMLFFISFLHNNGVGKIYKRFKDYSPFTSFTHGNKKHVISRNFALSRALHGVAYIYIVAINKNKQNYIFTSRMTKELKKMGTEWYKDIHKEIMLINGLFPHYILGLMEVKKRSTTKLIINPWLFAEYREKRQYDEFNGIPINQKYFDGWIKKDSNIKRTSHEDSDGDNYIQEVNQGNTYQINQFTPQ